MKTTVKLMSLGAVMMGSLLMGSCKKDTDANGNATVQFRLTDAPASYDHVYVDVQSVEVNTGNGWSTHPLAHPGVYDLIELNNGTDTVLVNADLPVGTISQVRLVLGPNNSVVVDGVTHPLQTPSAQQSGLKLNVHQTLEANKSYKMWLDFDAAKSIVRQGNGNYLLKPVIRTFTDLTDGRVEGYVLPQAANATVYAINGTDTMSAIPNPDGFFRFVGMQQATYNLWFDADSITSYQDHLIPGVNVTFGNVTNVGTITLTP